MSFLLISFFINILMILPSRSAYDFEHHQNTSGLILKNETFVADDNSTENNQGSNESEQVLKDIPEPSNRNMQTASHKVVSFEISQMISLPKSVNATLSKFEKTLAELKPLEELNSGRKNLLRNGEKLADVSSLLWNKTPPPEDKDDKMLIEPILPNERNSSQVARTTTDRPAQPDLMLIAKLKEIEARKQENPDKNLALQCQTSALHMFVRWICMWLFLRYFPSFMEMLV